MANYPKMDVKCPVLKQGVHYLTSDYKTRNPKRKHSGIDMIGKGYACDYVIAIDDGVVVTSTYSATAGYYVEIKQNDGSITRYLHLKKGSITVKKGDHVKKGQVIGYMGNSGSSNGAHLHFGVRVNGKDVDPLPYLEGKKTFDRVVIKQVPYQVYDNDKNKWLPFVNSNTNDYAGIHGHSISGLRIANLTYRVHDKVKKAWLPWVTGTSDYAGILTHDIDGVQIKGATYRVRLKKGKRLPWVTGDNDYAGIYGNSIDEVQIKID